MSTYRTLYPEIKPFHQCHLDVGDGHQVYVEQSGNPDGIPAVYLHGGPGGGSQPSQRQVFDPEKYHIVLFDQRGCGQSRPWASLEYNTTWHLVADMELIRIGLGFDKWLVCGGSWGSTLALTYAISHPDRVSALILRGIFTLRRLELEWFYQSGASFIFPDAWELFIDPIPADERGDLIGAYYRRLTGGDAAERIRCARAWSQWEGGTINLLPRPQQIDLFGKPDFAEAFARIETHYFHHGGFFDYDNWILQSVNAIQHIPTTIIQGRYDVCTPMKTAWELHQSMPQADFFIIPDSGHAFDEPGITDRLIRTTEYISRCN